MISRLRGILVARSEEGVEVATPGGVVYEVEVPLTVAQRLPPVGREVELLTVQVVREDAIELFGFLEPSERILFRRLLAAKGVGGQLALGMLSTFPAPRLARVLAEKDLAALVQVPRVGKKVAERLFLELADRVKDLQMDGAPGAEAAGPAQAAVQALVALGLPFQEADAAVRSALEEGDADDPDELIRKALARA